MTATFRTLGLAASLLVGTALAASAAVEGTNSTATVPNGSVSQYGRGDSTTVQTPAYQTTQRAPSQAGGPGNMAPHVTSGNPGGDNGSGDGGGSGGGAGGGR